MLLGPPEKRLKAQPLKTEKGGTVFRRAVGTSAIRTSLGEDSCM